MDHSQDPRTFFTTHHAAYVTSSRHAHGEDLDQLISGLQPAIGKTALDVATGGGHTAIALAQGGTKVTILDLTPAMLIAATEFAQAQGISLTAVEGSAECLPFAPSTFHIVSCRRACHHFGDVSMFLQEAYRVLLPGGRIGISDMTASHLNLEWLNALEITRDPSHHHALSRSDGLI